MPKTTTFTKNRNRNAVLVFLVGVSLFGLALSFAFTAYPFSITDDFAFRKPIIGTVFSAVCILGLFAAVYPDRCSGILDFDRFHTQDAGYQKLSVPTLAGHHPVCRHYFSHVLFIRKRKLCATCSGFFVGALVALVGVGLFFFRDFSMGEKPFVPLAIGVFAVAVGLLHSVLPIFRSSFRFITSLLFAVGAFVVLACVDAATRNISIDLFFVLLSVLWLMTDTALSRWDHNRICSKCVSEDC